MKIFGIAGWSGSGKTTLIQILIPELVSLGLKVSTIKHAHHRFDIDKPGKDSFQHREAGATEVLIGSRNRWALMHELRDEEEPDLPELIQRMSPVDLLLIEGFKRGDHPKLEVYRESLGKPMLWPEDDMVRAVASDGPVEGLDRPLLDLNNVVALADFVIANAVAPPASA